MMDNKETDRRVVLHKRKALSPPPSFPNSGVKWNLHMWFTYFSGLSFTGLTVAGGLDVSTCAPLCNEVIVPSLILFTGTYEVTGDDKTLRN